MTLPQHLLHADWSIHASKRWACHARLKGNRYHVDAPVQASTMTILGSLQGESVLAGFDFPIGLPASFAERAGITSFLTVFSEFGTGRWSDFFQVCREAREISLTRPFYPYAPGGRRRAHLVTGLGLLSSDGLFRSCDTSGRLACPLFWTLGSNQVGKAAIAGWTELLQPALKRGNVSLWPFSGGLKELVAAGGAVVVETYPGDVYAYVGATLPAVGGRQGKRSQASRAASAEGILTFSREASIELSPAAIDQLRDGFGDDRAGEDRFDALAGLLGMIAVVQGRRPAGIPDNPVVHQIEGWILGRSSR